MADLDLKGTHVLIAVGIDKEENAAGTDVIQNRAALWSQEFSTKGQAEKVRSWIAEKLDGVQKTFVYLEIFPR